MKPTANKRATVKSAKKEDERRAYEKTTVALEDLVSSSTTKTFRPLTLRDAAAITIKAAASASSLHAARKRMKKGKSRRQAAKTLESLDLKTTLKEANKHFRRQARRLLGDKPVTVSMDLHDVPYHGKPFKEANEVRGGKQKDGTRRFHAYATAYANEGRKRITLAMVFVPNHSSMRSVVRELLELVRRAGVQIERLLLDKGFFSVDVIRLLKRFSIPLIMPLKGNRLKKKRGSYKTFYVVKTVAGGVCREERVRAYSVVKYDAGKRFKRRGSRHWQYISWGVRLTPKQVAVEYRKRFGIESSYKLLKKARPRTSSRNPAYRVFLLAASFFLQNAWVEVKRVFCWRVPRWSEDFVSFRDFLDAMLAVVRGLYGEVAGFGPP